MKRTLISILFIVLSGACLAAEQGATAALEISDEQVRQALAEAADGFSSDEVLIDDKLREQFLRNCGVDPTSLTEQATQRWLLHRMLQLRKAGKLGVRATRRRADDTTLIQPIAEVAIRTVLDRHPVSIDDVFCDPVLREELQQEALKLDEDVDARLVRKAVLRLRKVRHLKPELVLRVASWNREVITLPLSDLVLDHLPSRPGVYLFRNAEGYLYIGEAENLAKRLGEHLGGSHNGGLAKLLASENRADVSVELHVFDTNSPGNQLRMRRAYESELIRSREPRFNLRP